MKRKKLGGTRQECLKAQLELLTGEAETNESGEADGSYESEEPEVNPEQPINPVGNKEGAENHGA